MQNEVFILSKSLKIDWENSEFYPNPQFYILLSLRYKNLIQAYLFYSNLFEEKKDKSPIFDFFLDCIFEECLVFNFFCLLWKKFCI